MMKNPAMADIMKNMTNGGGMPDISSLMKNPEIAGMAQSLMQDPSAMENLMKDPQVSKMANQYLKK